MTSYIFVFWHLIAFSLYQIHFFFFSTYNHPFVLCVFLPITLHSTISSSVFPRLPVLLARCFSSLSSCAASVCASVPGGHCYRESRKLLQPLTQFQRFQHRPGHQRGDHHAAVWRVLCTQERPPARPVLVGGHQFRCGPGHPNVYPQ